MLVTVETQHRVSLGKDLGFSKESVTLESEDGGHGSPFCWGGDPPMSQEGFKVKIESH